MYLSVLVPVLIKSENHIWTLSPPPILTVFASINYYSVHALSGIMPSNLVCLAQCCDCLSIKLLDSIIVIWGWGWNMDLTASLKLITVTSNKWGWIGGRNLILAIRDASHPQCLTLEWMEIIGPPVSPLSANISAETLWKTVFSNFLLLPSGWN